MRKGLLLICVLGISCASWAQGDKAAWTNLSTLRPGQKIQVVEIKSNKHSGSFVSFSETAISYQDDAGEQSVPRQNVRSVKLGASKRRLRNTLIGAGVGAGAGAAIGVGMWENRGFIGGKGVGALVGAAVGFVAGVVVGAVLPTHHTVYNANSH
jgi:hypothetical protein